MERHEDKRHQPIRSFVRRAGRMTASQQRALEELWPEYGVDYAPAVLDLDELFGRGAERVLEIGFGNGESLVEQARSHPEFDYIGIEVHEPGVGHCLLKAKDAQAANLKLIAHDAIEVLTYQVPTASLSRINLYFPDPWPKKRHHKRRIVQAPFLALCADKLAPGGTLHIATDWENYAQHIDEMLAGCADFVLVERREHGGETPPDRPGTKFERRGLEHGHRIWDWRFKKKPSEGNPAIS